MWQFLLVGASALGLWWLLKDKDTSSSASTPTIPDPPSDVVLAATSAPEVSVGTYAVTWAIFQKGTSVALYSGWTEYNDWDSAHTYYQMIDVFFAANHGVWTCANCVVGINLVDLRERAKGNFMPKLANTWVDCPAW